VRLVVCFLAFLVLTAEAPTDFKGLWHTPLAYAFPILDRIRSVPFSGWDLLMGLIGLVVLPTPSTWRGRARVLDFALLASFGGIGAAVVWGAAKGGDVRQSYFQISALLQLFLAVHVFTAVFKTGRDFLWLGRTILAAALYRAVACLVFFILFLRDGSIPYPESIAGHDVSALFVVAMLGLASWGLTSPRAKTLVVVVPLVLLLATATHYNNRRLAWVALAGGLFMLYIGMPMRRLSPRVKLWALAVAPFIALYIGLGWNRPYSPAFAPVAKLQSAIVGDDDSSKSREVENTGLVITLRLNLPLGTGFGHEYYEVSPAFSQGMKSFFPQYLYIPHNALLGLVAFTGVLLFPVIWTMLPVGAFLAARASLFARAPRDRLLAITAFAIPFVYSVMAFGDMGLQSTGVNVLLAVGFAAASRLAVGTGAWGRRRPGGRRTRPASVPARPEARPVAAREVGVTAQEAAGRAAR
jgi:hypothetical protein